MTQLVTRDVTSLTITGDDHSDPEEGRQTWWHLDEVKSETLSELVICALYEICVRIKQSKPSDLVREMLAIVEEDGDEDFATWKAYRDDRVAILARRDLTDAVSL